MEEPRDDATTGDDFAYSYKSSLLAAPFEFRLTSDALHWRKGGASGHTLYRNIRRVRLSYRPLTMQNHRFVAEIWSDGPKLTISSTSWKSMVEHERLDSRYRVFIAELCRRIGTARGQTRLQTGSPPIMYWIGVIVFAGSVARARGPDRPRAPVRGLGRRCVHRGLPRPAPVAGRHVLSPQPPRRVSSGRGPGGSATPRVVAACAPPAPSTWRSAPCGRRSSRGSRSSSRAGASS